MKRSALNKSTKHFKCTSRDELSHEMCNKSPQGLYTHKYSYW